MAFIFACSSPSVTTQETRVRTLPESMVEVDLPERPDSKVIPVGQDWVIALESGQMIDKAGICMSDQKAMRAARYVVAYNEIRGLYKIDLVTMERERSVYKRYLKIADEEVDFWKEKSKRTWLERHGGQLGLVIGVIVGAGLSIGIAAAINESTD